MKETLRNQDNVLAVLYQMMLDLVDRHDQDDILRTLLYKIVEFLDASHVSIDLLENDDTLVNYVATPGQPLRKGDAIRRGEGGWLSWQAIDSGQPEVLEDYAAWHQRRRTFDDFPYHAVLILPIRLGEQPIGAINILRDEPGNPFSETDIYAGEQLAQMVALVLDNAWVYQRLQAELVERRRSEEELRQVQAQMIEQQRQVAAFEERQHLARNLHDSVNQSIHSLVLFAETLTSALEKGGYDRARQIAARLEESARQALKETRLMLYELQPTASGEIIDLIAMLETRLSTVERRAGVQAQILLEGDMADCPRDWYENLFWIAIEALNNALKHAQARKVEIVLRCNPQGLEMVIADNGIGFESDKPRLGGIGLRNLHERAALLGGELVIDSAPGAGARIRFNAMI